MLDNLKIYLGIELSDTSKDSLLSLLISMAQDTAKKIALLDDDELLQYQNAIIRLSAFYYSKRKVDGITSQTQGSRSESFMNEIPSDIRNMLPRRLRVL